jgi:hypothetical protein
VGNLEAVVQLPERIQVRVRRVGCREVCLIVWAKVQLNPMLQLKVDVDVKDMSEEDGEYGLGWTRMTG